MNCVVLDNEELGLGGYAWEVKNSYSQVLYVIKIAGQFFHFSFFCLTFNVDWSHTRTSVHVKTDKHSSFQVSYGEKDVHYVEHNCLTPLHLETDHKMKFISIKSWIHIHWHFKNMLCLTQNTTEFIF